MSSFYKNFNGEKATKTAEKLIKQIGDKDASTRTTFALTKEGEKALSWIIDHFGKKIRSVIDNLCEQLRTSLQNHGETTFGNIIIELIKENPRRSEDRIRKTVVLSKKSLKILNEVSKKYEVPRDMLLDKGFIMLMTLLQNDSKLRLEKHQKALTIITKLWNDANKAEKKLEEFLDDEDPVLFGLGYAITYLMKISMAIEEEQKKGTPIDLDKI